MLPNLKTTATLSIEQNTESIEQARNVIGCLLVENKTWGIVKENNLTEADFPKENLRILFRTAGTLIEKGEACDISTIQEELKRNNQLEEAGGEIGIYSIANSAFSTKNVGTYIRFVKKESIEKRLNLLKKTFESATEPKEQQEITSKMQRLIQEKIELEGVEYWEKPQLFDSMATPEIPTDLLPGIFGQFAKELSMATETPEAMSVLVLLGVIATATTKRFKVSPREGWEEPVNIFSFIALDPANLKSFVLKSCIEPLVEWEENQSILMDEEIRKKNQKIKIMKRVLVTYALIKLRKTMSKKEKKLLSKSTNLKGN